MSEIKSKSELIDAFVKQNPMPERTYCKERTKIDNIILNFQFEYTKSEEIIEELEENGVDTEKYITKESKEKYALAEAEQEEKYFEHEKNCDNIFCKWAYQRDLFVRKNTQ